MARLILIPGLGANRLLFEAQRHYFDQSLFLPDWPAPLWTQVEGKKPVPETLRDYGRRWADRWLQTVLSKPEARRAYWVGGVSFGGQIALEAAQRLLEEGCPPKGVFLIASTRTARAVPGIFRVQSLVIGALGDELVKKMLGAVAGRFLKREGLSELDARLLTRITDAVDVKHLKWGKGAICGWKYEDKDWRALAQAGVRIHQIHGEKDWVIPMFKGHPDKVIPGGKHLINMTHADAVNEYIESRMKSDLSSDEE